MRFEELIDGPLDELEEDQIQAIIDELSVEQLAIFEKAVKKKTVKKVSAAKQKRTDEFHKALLGGIE